MADNGSKDIRATLQDLTNSSFWSRVKPYRCKSKETSTVNYLKTETRE